MSVTLEAVEEVCLGPVERIPPGEGRRFTVRGREIAVFRARGGALSAIDNRCPHRDGPLSEGVAGGGYVICPYHAYRFDLSTGACLNDAACSVAAYSVREESGQVVLKL